MLPCVKNNGDRSKRLRHEIKQRFWFVSNLIEKAFMEQIVSFRRQTTREHKKAEHFLPAISDLGMFIFGVLRFLRAS